MWHALEVAVELVDLVSHWRFYACFAVGLALAFFVYRSALDPDLAFIVATALAAAGLLVGAIWEWRT